MYARILLILLVLGGLSTKHVFAQGPTLAPSRLIVKPKPSTSFNENTTNIHWTRGNGSGYIVLISAVAINDGAGSVIEPDGSPYATNGNYRMEPASLVPNNPSYPNAPPSKTYLLRTSLYSGPGDTTAAVLNAMLGEKYIVQVYEYIIDANGNAYYSHTDPAYFTVPAIHPVIKSATITDFYQVTVNFSTLAESTTRSYRVLYSNDSTSFPYYNGVSVAPTNYPTTNNYQTVVRLNTFLPVYIKIYMQSGTDFTGTETFYSKAVLATEPGPLPVSLTSFDVKRATSTVSVRWATASELNNAGYGIERSLDGKAWSQLGYVAGHGTTVQANTYQYTSPYVGAAYYRLRQVDLSGAITYSPVRSIGADAASSFSVYPNPTTGNVSIIGGDTALPTTVVDGLGQTVLQLSAGQNMVDMSGKPAGLYIIQQGSNHTRLVVQ
jgi:hypothetical protein